MDIKILKTNKAVDHIASLFLTTKKTDFGVLKFTPDEVSYINNKINAEEYNVVVQNLGKPVLVHVVNDVKEHYIQIENARKCGNKMASLLLNEKSEKVQLISVIDDISFTRAAVEGMVLGLYQFNRYIKDKIKKQSRLKEIQLVYSLLSEENIDELSNLLKAVYLTRNLVNEPVSYLNAPQFATEIEILGKEAGFKVEVFDRKKIERLKMGGLLAVNKGSIDPPRFTILEWKPENAVNHKPYIFVGKGIVYDTGGLSLKPTPDSMDQMKCDMAGAAVVCGLFYAIAKNQLPIYAIGLVPSTDNRPDGNAYAPGDVITMHNGMHVEVLNTDAEGRMILADALSYAKKYKPELVIDIATLTGAAHFAIGHFATVVMGSAKHTSFNKLQECGYETYERTIEFPFWEEYGELLKSDIADIKNIGGRVAGAITAGKFLEHFTDYPWIHMDIAGPAFLTKDDGYLKKGGTAIGVRLLYEFLKTQVK